jgi:hypothetical protein
MAGSDGYTIQNADNVLAARKGVVIDRSGSLLNTTQPAFLVAPAVNQDHVATNAYVTVVWGTEIFDQRSNFATNAFTAPVTGKYQLNLSLVLTDVDSAATELEVTIATSNRNYFWLLDPRTMAVDGKITATISALADMDAADTALVQVYQTAGAAQMDIETDSRFSGFLAF